MELLVFRRIAYVIFLTSMVACSDDQPSEQASPEDDLIHTQTSESAQLPRVLETFEVGDQLYVRSLTVDAARKALWVGTSSGVMEIDLETHGLRNTFNRDAGLANEYVFSILVDSRGYKWFGTNGGGVSRYKDGEWKTYFPMHGLADYWVYSLAEQSTGTLWIGTWAGVNRLDASNNNFTTYLTELVNEWVYGIAVDSKDQVWFATEGGISMFDGQSWQAWTHEHGLGAPNMDKLPISHNTGLGTRSRHDLSVLSEGEMTYNPNYVFSVLVAADDTLWAGTWGGGVSHFDGKEWTNLTTEQGLAGNIVFSLVQDESGVLWFGTSEGLSRYDGHSWQNYGETEGLLDKAVYALAVDPAGNIWAGSRRGVARIGSDLH